MRDKNTMGKLGYIFDVLWWAVCTFIMFTSLCFFCLPENDAIASKYFLVWFVIITTVAGILLTFKNRRNNLSITVITLFPYGIYSAMSMYDLYPVRTVVASIIAATLCFFFVFMVVTRPRKSSRTSLFRVILLRLRHCVMGTATIVSLCALILIVPVAVNTIMGKGAYTEKPDRAPYVEEPQEWTIDKKMDTVKLLHEKNWGNLTMEEKLEVVATVKNIEMSTFGISDEVYVKSSALEYGVAGGFSPSEQSIDIDMEFLRSAPSEEIVNTICHESYHAYEYQQVEVYRGLSDKYKDLPLFNKVEKYSYEFSNYIDGDEDFDAYESQAIEADARAYAELRTEAYFEIIDAYYADVKG